MECMTWSEILPTNGSRSSNSNNHNNHNNGNVGIIDHNHHHNDMDNHLGPNNNHHHHPVEGGGAGGGGARSASSSSSSSMNAPTIKNHSVTHFGDYLYCFGGYDGRRNHATLLLYSLTERKWIRPILVPNTAATAATTNRHLRHQMDGIAADDEGEDDDDDGNDDDNEGEQLDETGNGNNDRNDHRMVGHGGGARSDRQEIVDDNDLRGEGEDRNHGARWLHDNENNDNNNNGEGHDDDHNHHGDRARIDRGHGRRFPSGAGGGFGGGGDAGAGRGMFLDDVPSYLNSDPTMVMMTGTPPPGRNGHSATLAVDPDDPDCASIFIIGGWLGTGPLAASDMHVLHIRNNRNYTSEAAGNNNNNNGVDTGDASDDDTVTMSNSANGNDDMEIDTSMAIYSRRQQQHHHRSSVQSDLPPPRPSLRWSCPGVRGTPPGPCNMHSADYIRRRQEVYVFRGGNGREYLNDLHACSTQTYEWRRVETTGQVPQQRANHSSAVLDGTGELFIFGGWNGTERLNDIHILDTETSNWTRPHIGGILPHPRAGMTLTALRGRLFLFGGSGTSSKCYHDLQILDREQMAWLDVTPYEAMSNRSTHSQSRHMIIEDNHSNPNMMDVDNMLDGGQSGSGNRAGSFTSSIYADWRSREMGRGTQSTGIANPNGDEDTIPTVLLYGRGPGRRAGHTATAVGSKIFVFGGSCGSDYLNDFFVLDSDPPPRAVVTEPTSLHLVERRLRHFYNDEEFSDVTFVVQGRRVYGHKMVLAIVSDCFRAMFTAGFRESSSSEIEITDCTYEAFLAVMDYIYTGAVPNPITTQPAAVMEILTPQRRQQFQQRQQVEMNRIVDVLELADRFMLDHLKQVCERMLESAVNADTLEYLHQVAQKTNAVQLLAVCEHFIRNRRIPR